MIYLNLALLREMMKAEKLTEGTIIRSALGRQIPRLLPQMQMLS